MSSTAFIVDRSTDEASRKVGWQIDFLIALEPGAAGSVAQIDAIGEHGECGGLKAQLAVLGVAGLGPAVGSAFKPFRVDPQAGSIPMKELEQIPRAVDEDKHGTATWVIPEARDHFSVEAVEGLAHITGFQSEEDTKAAGERQHGRRRVDRSSAASGRAAREAISMAVPQGRMIRSEAADVEAGDCSKSLGKSRFRRMGLRHDLATLAHPGDESLVLNAVQTREAQRAHATAVEGFKQRLTLFWSVSQAAVAAGANDGGVRGWVISGHRLHTRVCMLLMMRGG